VIFGIEIALAVALSAGIVVETPDLRPCSGEIMLRRRAESGTFGMNCTGRPTLPRSIPADQPSCVTEERACAFSDRGVRISGHYALENRSVGVHADPRSNGQSGT
jgi:hypothetical protein